MGTMEPDLSSRGVLVFQESLFTNRVGDKSNSFSSYSIPLHLDAGTLCALSKFERLACGSLEVLKEAPT